MIGPAAELGGRYWDRTSDLLGVNGVRLPSWPLPFAEGQVRDHSSGRFGEVQEGWRGLQPPKFLPIDHGGNAHVGFGGFADCAAAREFISSATGAGPSGVLGHVLNDHIGVATGGVQAGVWVVLGHVP